jgi:hypothetical protein
MVKFYTVYKLQRMPKGITVAIHPVAVSGDCAKLKRNTAFGDFS